MKKGRGGPWADDGGYWRTLTGEERLQVFESINLPREAVFWPNEGRFRVSLPARLLAGCVEALLRAGCICLSIDVYPGSGLASVRAGMVRDLIQP